MNRSELLIHSKVDQQPQRIIQYEPDHFKKVVVFLHGMQDDVTRYEAFAEFLAQHQLCVNLIELRGHGPYHQLGLFAKKNGWLIQIEDIHQIISMLAQHYQKEIILIGHSMGSLFARAYLKRQSRMLSRVILSGPPASNPFVKPLKLMLQSSPWLLRKQYSLLMHKKLLKEFNKEIENPRTEFDWLSFNSNNVDTYINNPYCGFKFSNQAYLDLFSLTLDVNQQPQESSHKNLDILICVGEYDPVALVQDGAVNQLEQQLSEMGHHVVQILYPHSRHEILFDDDQELVKEDILSFITA